MEVYDSNKHKLVSFNTVYFEYSDVHQAVKLLLEHLDVAVVYDKKESNPKWKLKLVALDSTSSQPKGDG